MKIKKLEISNFKSYGENTVIDFTKFEENSNILVTGLNQDASGADSNGSGKTGFFDAFSYVVFDKVPDGSSKDDLIRRGTEQMSVKGYWDKNGEDVLIERGRGLENFLKFSVNGTDLSRTTDRETQKAIISYLGYAEDNALYFKDFLNTTYLSTDALETFTGHGMSSEERLALICRFLNLALLDRAHNLTKVKRKAIERSMESTENTIKQLRNRISYEDQDRHVSFKDQIDNENKALQETENNIKNLEGSIKKGLELDKLNVGHQFLKDQMSSAQVSLNNVTESVKREQQQLNVNLELKETNDKAIEINTKEIIKLTEMNLSEECNKAKNLHEEAFAIRQGKTREIEDKKTEINGLTQLLNSTNWDCPECNTSLMFLDNQLTKHNKQEIESKISFCNNDLTRFNTEIKPLLQAEQTALDDHDKLYELAAKHSNLVFEQTQLGNRVFNCDPTTLNNLKQQVSDLQKSLADITIKFNEGLKAIQAIGIVETNIEERLRIQKELRDNSIKHISVIEVQIENRERDITQIKGLEKGIEDKKKEFEDYQFCEKSFKTIRRMKVESFLPEFEEKVNEYLEKFDTGFLIRLNTLTEKKSSKEGEDKYKQQFDISVIDDQNTSAPFSTVNAGDKRRIAVAVGFALRDLTLNKGYIDFEFFLADEIVDKMDRLGLQKFFKILETIPGQKLIITHSDDLKDNFVDNLVVEKQNGISKITSYKKVG